MTAGFSKANRKSDGGVTSSDSHLGVDLRGDADAVIAGDGELVVQDPAGGAQPRLETQVGGEGVQVGHVTVSYEQVVAGAVHIMGHLRQNGQIMADEVSAETLKGV